MKKTLLVAVLAALPLTSMAALGDACKAGTGSAIASSTDGTKFVRVGFTPVCSANTIVRFDQSSTALWGGAGSAKGKNAFRGSTDGGAVKPHTSDCGADGCSETEVDAAGGAAASAS